MTDTQHLPVPPKNDADFSRGLCTLKETVDHVVTPHRVAHVLHEITAFAQILDLPLRDQDASITTPFKNVVAHFTSYAKEIAKWSTLKRYTRQYLILGDLVKFRKSLNELFLAAIVVNSVPRATPAPIQDSSGGKSEGVKWQAASNLDVFSNRPYSPAPPLDRNTSSTRLRWFWAMFITVDGGKEYIRGVLRRAVEDIMQSLGDEGLIGNHDMELFETAQDRRDSRELVRLLLEIAEHSDHNEKFKTRLLQLLEEHPATESLIAPPEPRYTVERDPVAIAAPFLMSVRPESTNVMRNRVVSVTCFYHGAGNNELEGRTPATARPRIWCATTEPHPTWCHDARQGAKGIVPQGSTARRGILHPSRPDRVPECPVLTV
ncbi:hypothetical protein C8R46DRAFT_1115394 [Mycena filopes]|nr:hypothetical protein C8R46DRAFT_1115394 [Mycena filopes]